MSALCAVCDDTNLTTRLCAKCTDDPANADWTQDDARADSDRIELRAAPIRLADLTDKRFDLTPKQRAIVNLWIAGRVERYRYYDHRGRSRGWRVRVRPWRQRELARHLACHHRTVQRALIRGLVF